MKILKVNYGREILVDDEDWELISHYKWYAREKGRTFYASTHIHNGGERKTIQMHILLLPVIPEGFQRDHKDRNGLNNTRDNLRVVPKSVNMLNRQVKRFRDFPQGVYKVGNKYQAQCSKSYLGTFDTVERASEVYQQFKQNLIQTLLKEI